MSTKKIVERQRGATDKSIGALTAQQQIFVKALLASDNFSPTEAAKQAGYKYPSQSGAQLMGHDVIRAAIGKELRLRKERLQWKSDEVLESLRNVVQLDITELYDNDGNLSMEEIKKLPPHLRQCVTEVRAVRKFYTNEEGEREYYNQLEVKWMSKDQALHLALKHFGLLNDDLHVHVLDDQVKQRVIVELLGQIGGRGNVIDATAIERKAIE
jgi:phage terminase small subunit